MLFSKTLCNSNSSKRILVSVAVLLSCSVMLLPAHASAQGSFNWSAKIYAGITSRTWTQNAGSTTITHYLPCSGNYSNQYEITLIKDTAIPKYYAKKTYTCGKTNTSLWTGTDRGTYKFYLRHFQYTTITATGKVSYQ